MHANRAYRAEQMGNFKWFECGDVEQTSDLSTQFIHVKNMVLFFSLLL